MQTNIAPATKETDYQLASILEEVTVDLLTAGQEQEVLEFLSQRPIHTVALTSLIRDNGLVSPLNRGTFYGCRDINGHLEGVALIGHATLLETVSDRALRALALTSRNCPYLHMIMGEHDRVADFWQKYSEDGRERRLACREWLYELRWPAALSETSAGLRQAMVDELNLVMPVQAELAFEESRVDPLRVDPVGFRQRCLRRIQQGRTFVLVENGELVFKADIISQTSEVIYLEGVWVAKDRRNNGTGYQCMSELSRKLLSEVKSICLLVNEDNKEAQAFYRRCGFLFRATYETIFPGKKEH